MTLGWDTLVVVLSVLGTGFALWRVLNSSLNKLDARVGKLEDGVGSVSSTLAGLQGELKGRRQAESEQQFKEIMETLGDRYKDG